MLLKQCARCGKPVAYPAKYCEQCKPIVEEQQATNAKLSKRRYNKQYDAKRNPDHVKFYNSNEWRLLKERKLQSAKYKCEDCMSLYRQGLIQLKDVKLATEVHHVIELTEDFSKRFEWSNLKALCHTHHNKMHHRYMAKKSR